LCQLQEYAETHRGSGQEKGCGDRAEKVEQLQDIMAYGVMSTPGVVVDGKVVHAGGVPSLEKIGGWL
jgi:predicted thioredoxin/glutaredoxin